MSQCKEEEVDSLIDLVSDTELLFKHMRRESDSDTKQVYFYLFQASCSSCRLYLMHLLFVSALVAGGS